MSSKQHLLWNLKLSISVPDEVWANDELLEEINSALDEIDFIGLLRTHIAFATSNEELSNKLIIKDE